MELGWAEPHGLVQVEPPGQQGRGLVLEQEPALEQESVGERLVWPLLESGRELELRRAAFPVPRLGLERKMHRQLTPSWR